jgi:gas vesicle protein
MRERHTIAWGAILGTVVGATAAYLFFTERGRRFRRDVEPELETLVREAMRIGKTVTDLRQHRTSPLRPGGPSTPLAWPRRS